MPPGVTATITDQSDNSQTVITSANQFATSIDVIFDQIGGTETLTLQYAIGEDTTANFGIVDVVATSNNPEDTTPKIAFADFEIVGNSSYYTQFNFGFVSASPFSLSPGNPIVVTMSGFTPNSAATLSLGFDSDGDPFIIEFPTEAAGADAD